MATTVMDCHDGFLAEIISAPKDDAPRLVYADWLDEHGEMARAEFIRVQVELAKLPENKDSARRSSLGEQCCCRGDPAIAPGFHCRPCLELARRIFKLRRRERELWRERWRKGDFPLDVITARAWNYLLPGDSPPNRAPAAVYYRGFVSSVTCACADWLAHGGTVVRAQPVTRVTLSDLRIEIYDDGRAHLIFWSLPIEIIRSGSKKLLAEPYPSKQEALDGISRRCIAWAKSGE